MNGLDKIKYLLKNIGFLTLSSLGIKVISFFLVPLYTSVLTTTEYGTYDIFNTTISLLIPFFTLNIKESTIRFALSDEYSKRDVFIISVKYSALSIIYFGVVLLINHFLLVSVAMDDYKWLILVMYISQVLQGIATNFVRGLDDLKSIAISTVICSLTVVVLNIVFLVPLNMGLTGYFLANIIGPIIQVLYLLIISKAWKYLKSGGINKKLSKEMVGYSTPMIANSTAWWINSVSDRYIIIWICGIAESGIYSVASKIPTIVDMFQGIFSQAWTLSAVKEFNSEDKNGFFSKMYGMYNMCMTIVSSFVILLSRILAKFLYAKDFFPAWKYVPFLIIAVLFGALAGYCGAIFSAVKDSKAFAYSTLVGAGVNVLLNFVLVKKFGALGAAIATTISYAIIYWLRLRKMRKYINLRINLFRDWCGYIALLVQTMIFLLFEQETVILYITQGMIFIFVVCLFIEQYKLLFGRIRNFRREI